jgi:hypothetical protein
MRRFARTFAAATAALALMAFAHTEPQYTVEFPDGWTVEPANAENLVVAMPATKSEDGANCNSQYIERAELAAFTQEQLNAQFSTPFTAEAWAGFLAMDVSKIKVSETAAVDIGGKYLQVATIVLEAEGSPITVRMGFVTAPGKVFNVGCYVKSPGYDALKDAFETTVKSLRPV